MHENVAHLPHIPHYLTPGEALYAMAMGAGSVLAIVLALLVLSIAYYVIFNPEDPRDKLGPNARPFMTPGLRASLKAELEPTKKD